MRSGKLYTNKAQAAAVLDGAKYMYSWLCVKDLQGGFQEGCGIQFFTGL